MFNIEMFNEALESGNIRRVRLYLRLMYAYWPDDDLDVVVENIYDLLDSSGVGAVRTLCSFRGSLVDKQTLLSDLRFIMKGKSILKPDIEDKYAISIAKIRNLGKMLQSGTPQSYTAKAVGINKNTIVGIEDFLQINKTKRDALLKEAYKAIEEGVSTRKFGKAIGISKSHAARIMVSVRPLHDSNKPVQ
jgi:hypothetical protein